MNDAKLLIVLGMWFTIRALMFWHEIDEHHKNGWRHIAWAVLLTAFAAMTWYRLFTGGA